jgi:hypothetical protein
MPTRSGSLRHWHEFYTLLGTVSATMVGPLFVPAAVDSCVSGSDRRVPLRMFLSASVVHFSGILAASSIVLAPVQSWLLLGVLIPGVRDRRTRGLPRRNCVKAVVDWARWCSSTRRGIRLV